MYSATAGLNRTESAEFLSRRLGRPLNERKLRYWEASGLLSPLKPPNGGSGRFCPTVFTLPDLLAAEILASLRLEGVSLQKLRRALATLADLFPDARELPAAWRLAVTVRGEVVHVARIENEPALVELTRQPGQVALFDVGTLARDVRAVLETRGRAA